MDIETVADIRLAGRAINNNWPVSADMRERVVNRMFELVDSGVPDLEIAAAKVLLAADAVNDKKHALEQKRIADEHARKLQLIELAVKLGIARNDSGGDRSDNSSASVGAVGGSTAGITS